MTPGSKALVAAIGAGLLVVGCYNTAAEDESPSLAQLALSVCEEAVPASRVIDGIPAYAQCASSSNSAIYSNNGVDTATSALSAEWKRTQYNGGYQCTELVHRYWLFRWNVTWIPNGDAWTWCDLTPPSSSGIVKTTVPVHGDAIVFARSTCGSDPVYGHVALVDTVDAAASKVTYVEQNGANRRTNAWSCASCFLHVVANNGTAGAGGSTGAAGASSTAGGALPAGGTGGRASTTLGNTTSAGTSSTVTSQGGARTTTSQGGSPTTLVGGAATSSGGNAHLGTSGTTAVANSTSTTPPTTAGGNTFAPGASSTSPGEANGDEIEQDPGCGCKVTGRGPSSLSHFGFTAAALLALMRRKRRDRAQRS